MIFKIVAPNNAVSIVLAEDIRRIEFPSTSVGSGFSPSMPITIRMVDGSTIPSTYAQAGPIEDLLAALHPTPACVVPAAAPAIAPAIAPAK